MVLVILFLLPLAYSESPECQAEWQKVLASANPQTSAGESYQKMALYSGFTINNLGNYDSCNKISIARYAVVTLNEVPLVVQTFCGPIVCTEADYFNSTLPMLQATPIEVVFSHKYQEDYYTTYSASAILMLVFIFTLVGIAVIATVLEYFATEGMKNALWYECFVCFSLIKNGKTLLTTRSQEVFGASDTFDILNAARAMSLGWIILFHIVIIALNVSVLSNYDSILDLFGDLEYQLVLNGIDGVDTWIWISGFLMAYFFLGELEQNDGFSVVDLGKHYLHRIFRRSPSTLFVILFFMSMQRYLGNGPMFYHIHEKSIVNECDDYLYTNILYLNNFIPNGRGNFCLMTGWPIAVDMQYYLALSLLVLVYAKLSKPLGWALIAVICIGGITTSGIVASDKDLKASPVRPNEYFWWYYTKPYTRGSGYALGIGGAFILYSYRRLQKRNIVYDSFANAIADAFTNVYFRYGAFLLGFAIFNVFVFVQYDSFTHPGPKYDYEEWTDAANVAYIALEKFGISLGLTLMFLPLLLGHFTWIIAFMAFPVWNIFARLSFAAYLLHHFIITVVFASQKNVTEIDTYNNIMDTIYFYLLSVFCAIPVVLLIEFPVANLDKRFLKKQLKPIGYQELKTEDPDKEERQDN
jgi:peptidoglycan/LPS O-acetylase OafA/YrhL